VIRPAAEAVVNGLVQEQGFGTVEVPPDERLLNALNGTQKKYRALVDAEKKANHGWVKDPWLTREGWDWSLPPETTHLPFLEFNIEGTIEEKPGISVPRRWAWSLKNPALFRLEGDSMEPAFEGGDLVIVERQAQETRDGVYAFLTTFGITVSRVEALPDGKVRLVAGNEGYPSRVVSLRELDVIGEVKGRLSGIGP